MTLTDTIEKAAPPSNIAVATRAFGDRYPAITGMWRLRLVGTLLFLSSLMYVSWALASLNTARPWVAWPFVVANGFSILYLLVNVVNQWSRLVPLPRTVIRGEEMHVAVIIPTCGEPVPMVLRTVLSVVAQDWPGEMLTIIVSDDGHDESLRLCLEDLPVLYHSPPPRDAPGRDGAAKSGNLNSALALIIEVCPHAQWVETRDADDEVGSDGFLRQVIGQLVADGNLAYVQTIKETHVSSGDPFDNRASMFYRGQMLARNAANAVIPCGSGLVWRLTALVEIGGFPTWNLVEDLQSGVEALRRQWSGLYLPIVGAVGQHSPQDIPNVYKQRGTWALDTVRLMVWGELRGLDFRQRLFFYGMALDYFNAFTLLIYVPCVALSLFGFEPIVAKGWSYFIFMAPMVVLTEIWMLLMNVPYNDRRRRQRRPVRAVWRARTVFTGLATVYMVATIKALLCGRGRKPVYKVTRKTDQIRWYWREVLPQAALVGTLIVAVVVALGLGTIPHWTMLVGSCYWGGVYIAQLVAFITRSWFGVTWSMLPAWVRRRNHMAAALGAHPGRQEARYPALASGQPIMASE